MHSSNIHMGHTNDNAVDSFTFLSPIENVNDVTHYVSIKNECRQLKAKQLWPNVNRSVKLCCWTVGILTYTHAPWRRKRRRKITLLMSPQWWPTYLYFSSKFNPRREKTYTQDAITTIIRTHIPSEQDSNREKRQTGLAHPFQNRLIVHCDSLEYIF